VPIALASSFRQAEVVTGPEVPATVDPWTVRCGELRLAADEQGRALCLADSQWVAARENHPFWDSYWSIWPPDVVHNQASTVGDHQAQHLMGALTRDERLFSIQVQTEGRGDWISCPFAIAGQLIWLAHAPRWTTRALIETSAGTKALSWTYRRYADYNQDLPHGVNQFTDTERTGG
jgi:hypothetical protein